MSQVTISITGTPSEVRSALQELLGTPAAAAVTAATPTPVVDDGKSGKGGRKKETPAPAGAPASAADPFAQPAAAAPAADPFAAPAATTAAPTEQAPASSGPAATTTASPSEGGAEVSYDELKTLMTNVLAKKSASFAQKALLDATGFKALTGLPKEMYPKAKAALEAALA